VLVAYDKVCLSALKIVPLQMWRQKCLRESAIMMSPERPRQQKEVEAYTNYCGVRLPRDTRSQVRTSLFLSPSAHVKLSEH